MIDLDGEKFLEIEEDSPRMFKYTPNTDMIEFLISQGVEVVDFKGHDYEYSVGQSFKLAKLDYGSKHYYRGIQLTRRKISPNQKQEDPLWYSWQLNTYSNCPVGSSGLFWQLFNSGNVLFDLNSRDKPAWVAPNGLIIIFEHPQEYTLPDQLKNIYAPMEIDKENIESFVLVLDPKKVKIIKFVGNEHLKFDEPQYIISPDWDGANYIYFHMKDK